MRVERVDLAVVGAGPAGLEAAIEAARSGARVLVVDESPQPGGRLPLQLHEQERVGERGGGFRIGLREAKALADAAGAAGVRIVLGASAWGLFPGWELYLQAVDPADPDRVPDLVVAPTVVVATGAAQNPLALPGWTLPGVLGVGAAQMLVNVHRIRPGQRVVVVGVDPLGLTVAQQLTLGGVEVRAILPPAPGPFVLGAGSPAELIRRLARFAEHAPSAGLRVAGQLVRGTGADRAAAWLFPREGVPVWGTPLLLRRAATAILGTECVTGVRVADLDAAGQVVPGSEEEWPVDAVVTSAGLHPLVELVQLAGVEVTHIPELGGHVPLHGPDLQTRVPGLFVAGSVTGVAGAEVAAAEGRIAGVAAARRLGRIGLAEAEGRLGEARAALAEARRHGLALVPDGERGLERLDECWRAGGS